MSHLLSYRLVQVLPLISFLTVLYSLRKEHGFCPRERRSRWLQGEVQTAHLLEKVPTRGPLRPPALFPESLIALLGPDTWLYLRRGDTIRWLGKDKGTSAAREIHVQVHVFPLPQGHTGHVSSHLFTPAMARVIRLRAPPGIYVC